MSFMLPYTQGPIDKEYEFIVNCYGIGYDAANGIMLGGPIGLTDSSIMEVKAKFALLKSIAKKRFPSKLNSIKRCEELTILNLNGKLSDKKFLELLRNEAVKAGGDANLCKIAGLRINSMEHKRGSRYGPPGSKTQKKFIKPPLERLFSNNTHGVSSDKRPSGPLDKLIDPKKYKRMGGF